MAEKTMVPGVSLDTHPSPYLRLHIYNKPEDVPPDQLENVCLLLSRIARNIGAISSKRGLTIRIGTDLQGSCEVKPIAIKKVIWREGEDGPRFLVIHGKSNNEIPAELVFLLNGHPLLRTVFTSAPPYAPWINPRKESTIPPLEPGSQAVAEMANINYHTP